jgi:hypothetical protein
MLSTSDVKLGTVAAPYRCLVAGPDPWTAGTQISLVHPSMADAVAVASVSTCTVCWSPGPRTVSLTVHSYSVWSSHELLRIHITNYALPSLNVLNHRKILT